MDYIRIHMNVVASTIKAGVQHAYVAAPEKALLDQLYLAPGSDDLDYLGELRLQSAEDRTGGETDLSARLTKR